MIRDVHPGSGFFSHPRSRSQKSAGARFRIRNVRKYLCHCIDLLSAYQSLETVPLNILVPDPDPNSELPKKNEGLYLRTQLLSYNIEKIK